MMVPLDREIDTVLATIKRYYNGCDSLDLEEDISNQIDHFIYWHNAVKVELEIAEYRYKEQPRGGLNIVITLTGDSYDAPER